MHGDTGSIPGSGRSPGGGNGNPLQLFFPREPHGQRILVGHSAYGPKGLDKTEHTHMHAQIWCQKLAIMSRKSTRERGHSNKKDLERRDRNGGRSRPGQCMLTSVQDVKSLPPRQQGS